MKLAIVGGTGEEGFGLALRLGAAGHDVVIGSRQAERGAEAAEKALDLLGSEGSVTGTSNQEAVASNEVIFVTVPFAGQADIYSSIKDHVSKGSVIIDATSPLATAVGGKPWQVVAPWHGSAAEQAQAILGDKAKIVSAFQTIPGRELQDLGHRMDADVPVCGDDADAKAVAGALIESIPGLRWVDCGSLSMARIAETLTALLISVNKTYKIHDGGLRFTGRESWGEPGR